MINIFLIIGLLVYGLVSSEPLWGIVAGLIAIASAIGELVDSRKK